MSTTITRKLTKAGINLEHVTINSAREVEVSRDATERTRKSVAKVLGWGGFRCGHGGWVLRKDYQASGDWNDTASRWHY